MVTQPHPGCQTTGGAAKCTRANTQKVVHARTYTHEGRHTFTHGAEGMRRQSTWFKFENHKTIHSSKRLNKVDRRRKGKGRLGSVQHTDVEADLPLVNNLVTNCSSHGVT